MVNALFCDQENTHDYFLLMRSLIQRHGIPIALYTDRYSVFKNVPGSGHAGAPTQFSRAMDELGIQLAFALSPQTKGRVERTAGTFRPFQPPPRTSPGLCLAASQTERDRFDPIDPMERNAVTPAHLTPWNAALSPPRLRAHVYRPIFHHGTAALE